MRNIKQFKNKLLIIATITVLATGLMLAVTHNDAEAITPKTGTFALKCTDQVGSFFDPSLTGGTNFASGQTNCNALGLATVSSITTITGGPVYSCITLTTPVGLDSYAISSSGFFTYKSTDLIQCFFDELGGLADLSKEFCANGQSAAHTSKVIGHYTITGGLVNGQKVSGGTGTVNSSVNHCAIGTAPYGNSVKTTIVGTIVY